MQTMGAALAVRYRPARSVIALDTPEESRGHNK